LEKNPSVQGTQFGFDSSGDPEEAEAPLSPLSVDDLERPASTFSLSNASSCYSKFSAANIQEKTVLNLLEILPIQPPPTKLSKLCQEKIPSENSTVITLGGTKESREQPPLKLPKLLLEMFPSAPTVTSAPTPTIHESKGQLSAKLMVAEIEKIELEKLKLIAERDALVAYKNAMIAKKNYYETIMAIKAAAEPIYYVADSQNVQNNDS